MKEMSVNDKKIIIRKAETIDAKALIEYLNIIGGESEFLTFGAGQFDMSIEEEEKHIENVSNKKNDLFIIAEINGEVIGSLGFTGGLRERNIHVGEFGVSVLKEYWGNKVGEELIRYLIKWSKETGLIRKINLIVRVDNERGIYLYEKLGFVKEGLLKRDFLVESKFYDSLIMGLLID